MLELVAELILSPPKLDLWFTLRKKKGAAKVKKSRRIEGQPYAFFVHIEADKKSKKGRKT